MLVGERDRLFEEARRVRPLAAQGVGARQPARTMARRLVAPNSSATFIMRAASSMAPGSSPRATPKSRTKVECSTCVKGSAGRDELLGLAQTLSRLPPCALCTQYIAAPSRGRSPRCEEPITSLRTGGPRKNSSRARSHSPKLPPKPSATASSKLRQGAQFPVAGSSAQPNDLSRVLHGPRRGDRARAKRSNTRTGAESRRQCRRGAGRPHSALEEARSTPPPFARSRSPRRAGGADRGGSGGRRRHGPAAARAAARTPRANDASPRARRGARPSLPRGRASAPPRLALRLPPNARQSRPRVRPVARGRASPSPAPRPRCTAARRAASCDW